MSHTPTSTTTVFILSSGTASVAPTLPSNHTSSLPLVPIIAGLVGGIILACGGVLGWWLWGRSVKLKNVRRRQTVVGDTLLTQVTNANTVLNARDRPAPRPSSSTMTSKDDTRIRFVAPAARPEKCATPSPEFSLVSLEKDAPSTSTSHVRPGMRLFCESPSSSAAVLPNTTPSSPAIQAQQKPHTSTTAGSGSLSSSNPTSSSITPFKPLIYRIPEPRAVPAEPLLPPPRVLPLSVQDKPRWLHTPPDSPTSLTASYSSAHLERD